jgi:glutamate-5-semialdehyde dehydrogenase
MNPITPLLQATKQASAVVRRLSPALKTDLLNRLADVLIAYTAEIVAENQHDLDRMDSTDPKYDRLKLTESRIDGLAQSLREVALLPDPAGEILVDRTIEQGLKLKKISVPLGVVGVIYEARPNVTVDVASLCLRSGNACVLKGGKRSRFLKPVSGGPDSRRARRV